MRKNEFISSQTCVYCNFEAKQKNDGKYVCGLKEKDKFMCKKHEKKSVPWKLNINMQSLRSAVMKNDSELVLKEELWLKDVPNDTRQLAVKDAESAYISAISLKRLGHIDTFRLKTKPDYSPKQTFWISKGAFLPKWRIFIKRLKKDSSLIFSKRYLKFIRNRQAEYPMQIMKDHNCWYLLYLYDREAKIYPPPIYETISMDPGIRTFQTCYSPQGLVVKMGEPQIAKIMKINKKIDSLNRIKSNKVIKRRTNKIVKETIQQEIKPCRRKFNYRIEKTKEEINKENKAKQRAKKKKLKEENAKSKKKGSAVVIPVITPKITHKFKKKTKIQKKKRVIDKNDKQVHIEKLTKRTRRNINKRLHKLHKKRSDIVSDLHHQLSSRLTNRSQNILLPTFGTSKMLKSDKIPKQVKRMMGILSFYKFKQKMIIQCAKKNRDLHIVSEAFTTKTCGRCGNEKEVKKDKIYKCTECKYVMDRDVHGARNIFIRYQTLCA